MSSATSEPMLTDDDLDDWADSEVDDDNLKAVHPLDGRRRVENKLEDLRLLRETSEYDFDYL